MVSASFAASPGLAAAAKSLGSDLAGFIVDAAQRNILMLDVLRRRGDNYLEHMAMAAPNVLGFAFEAVMDGRTLPRPVNYGLVRIIAPAGVDRFDMEATVEAIGPVFQPQPPHISLDDIREVLTAAGPLEGEALARFARISRMFPEPLPARETAAGAGELHQRPSGTASARSAAARTGPRLTSRRSVSKK